MTVSLKRLIATVVLIAMALAGTPTKALANDGLDMIRYGFQSEKKGVEVYRPVSANLNKNPFREKTVSATLRGASIRVERATLSERNVAKLLTREAMPDPVVNQPVMIDHSVCQVHLPVFQNTPPKNFIAAWRNKMEDAVALGKEMTGHGLAYLQNGIEAERQFATSLTAASRQHTAPFLAKLPACQLPSAAEISGEGESSQPLQALATISNISEADEMPNLICLPSRPLKRMSCHNIYIAMLEGTQEDGFSPGQQLLIEEYMPTAVPAIKAKSAALKVPVMSIGFQKKSEVKINKVKTMQKNYQFQKPAQVHPVIMKTLEIWNEMVRPLMDVEKATTIASEVYQRLELDADFHGSLRKFERWGSYGDIR